MKTPPPSNGLRVSHTVMPEQPPTSLPKWRWYIRAEWAETKLKVNALCVALLLGLSITAQETHQRCHIMGLYDVPAPQSTEVCYTATQLLGVLGCYTFDVEANPECAPQDYTGDGVINTADVLHVLGYFQPDCDELLDFPVVFHVIHLGEPLGEGTNISDWQIETQLAALNAAFNPSEYAVGISDEYYTGAGSRIRFHFADSIAPGMDHPGITRHYGPDIHPLYETAGIGYNGTYNNEQAIKEATTWGWDNAINIFVVSRIQNNNTTLGYAYFARTDWRDGIVMRSDGCGSVVHGWEHECCDYTLIPSRDEGDLGTHEMGHYFGLYHPFHQTNDCDGIEVNCETSGDRVCDTHPTTDNDLSCTNPQCDDGTVLHNWMHYTAETCRNQFTEGQKARMRSYAFTEPFDPKRTILWGL